MLNWKHSVGILAIAAVGFVAGRTLPTGGNAEAAQPDKKTDKTADKKEQPKGEKPGMSMPAPPTPGPEHKVLEAFIGEFEGGGSMWMAPGTPAMPFKGSVKRESVLDGLFIAGHVSGDPMEPGGKAFKGFEMMGFNTIEKRYEMVWAENMATQFTTTSGTYDAAKKTFTFSGDCYNPMTMKKERSRSTVDISNPDKHVMTGYGIGPDGKEFKNFEGTFTRKGKGK